MNKIEDLLPGVPVILADGLFPESKRVLQYLDKASAIVCCDGATVKLLKYGLQPTHIVGDMDSLPHQYQRQFAARIVSSADQETNDLTKAVNHALSLGYEQAVVLGATGQREDHALGNIGLLVEHGEKLQLQCISDFGTFTPLYESSTMSSYPAQQISIFNVVGQVELTSHNLKYPIENRVLTNWWQGTLNEALGHDFTLNFSGGVLVIYRAL